MNALERKVLELIGEDADAPDVFVDTEEGMAPVRQAISDAVQEIVMLTGSNRRQYFIPLRERIAFYRLTPARGSIGWMSDAWCVTQKRRLEQTDLIRLASYDPRWMIHTGTTEAYLPVGKDIVGFYPKPAADGDVIELTIIEIPAVYESSADQVKLRESFQYAVVNFAVAEFWASRGDAAEAQAHTSKYLDALGLAQEYLPLIGQTRFAQTRKEPWPTATS